MRSSALLIMLVFNLCSSYGQHFLGFMAGANFSEIPYSDFFHHADVYEKVSQTYGVDFTSPVYKNLYYSVGITYNRFDAHIIGYTGSPSHSREDDIDLKLGYISLSLMPQYSFGGKRIFYIKAGGYFSLLLNSRKVGTFDTWVVNGDHLTGKIDRSANNDYENIDFGLCADTGVRLNISYNARIVPQIGVNYGLYKYNLVGSNVNDIRRAGFKSLHFLLGIDIDLGAKKPGGKLHSVCEAPFRIIPGLLP